MAIDGGEERISKRTALEHQSPFEEQLGTSG